ncbi:agamous-like mads-box protein agl80 [Phtheirospermum japonicum]|uniref:Agamous-like mads-box protein agl80 n=1 Tax=Phtheirospermum japonicum TaxID=374723 RepID=A0A830CBY6_9LAMI|nr:agamous-like mads-box protein agl80 [Phtheirospermum japonicum]
MARSKVRYKLIANENARRRTFRKRKSNLLKKMKELKMLCNVDACAIIFSEHEEARPDVWPCRVEAFRLAEQLRNTPHPSEAINNMDQQGFLKRILSRLSKNLNKETKKIESLEMERVLAKCLDGNYVHELNNYNLDDLKALDCLLEEKIEMVNNRLI